jgi:hypothetical protein
MAKANALAFYNTTILLIAKRLVGMGKMGMGEMYKSRDYVLLAVDMFVEQSWVQCHYCCKTPTSLPKWSPMVGSKPCPQIKTRAEVNGSGKRSSLLQWQKGWWGGGKWGEGGEM